jgi:hypothetical protein
VDHGTRDAQAARSKIVNLHMIHIWCADHRHVQWFCSQNVSWYTSPGRLRLRMRKVTAMPHRRNVLDVLPLTRPIDSQFVRILRYIRQRTYRSQMEPPGGDQITRWIRTQNQLWASPSADEKTSA